MVYSMITGDMLTFGIIYTIVLFGFSQSFYFLNKGVKQSPYHSYPSTWMALFQTTLGDYNVRTLTFLGPKIVYEKANFCIFFTVPRSGFDNVPCSGQNRFHCVHGFCADFATEHVDCYDGKHVRPCDWAERKRMDEASKHFNRMLTFLLSTVIGWFPRNRGDWGTNSLIN